jgi:hypothetical protein
MIHDKKTSRVWLTASLLGASLLVSGLAISAVAQDAQTQEKATTSSKKATSGGRDPFKKYEPPRVSTKLAGQANVPSIQDRINRYKAQKAAAMSARMTAPKPTTALLLSEIQVIGISRTPRGYAAIIEATPIKLSYVVYPGELFYDGQLVAIEDSRLVFRRETVFTDGRRERSVEYKPLRQPSPVNAMPVPGAANTSQSVAAANPQ